MLRLLAALCALPFVSGCQYDITTLIKVREPALVAVYPHREDYPETPLLRAGAMPQKAKVPAATVRDARVARDERGGVRIESEPTCGASGETFVWDDGTVTLWRPESVRPLDGEEDVVWGEGPDVRMRYQYIARRGFHCHRSPVAALDLSTPRSNVLEIREVRQPNPERRGDAVLGLPFLGVGLFSLGAGLLLHGETGGARAGLIASSLVSGSFGGSMVAIGLFHLFATRHETPIFVAPQSGRP